MTRLRIAAVAAMLALIACPAVAMADEVLPLLPHTGSEVNPPKLSKTDLAPTEPRGSDGTDTYSPNGVDVQPTLQTRHFGGRVELICTVATTPGSLKVVNQGIEPLPPGARIKWQVKNPPLRGFFALIGQLDAGETLIADGIVDGDVPAGADCMARVI